MRIQRLPTVVANQIAAGEVIERPASVVKELLENALDAGADSISIDIGFGGLNQIKMSDNGRGIVAEDLPLAIAAHATSKISELKDLSFIASMGFRGEALASIASISRLSISSKTKEQAHAMCLTTEGGQSIQIGPCARNQGTTIDVRDIFFNTPVRKKFLKPERNEFQMIEQVVKRFALSAPQIAIRLSHNDKQQLDLAAAHCDKTRLARIRKLLGKTFLDQSYALNVEHADLFLEGFISTKDYQPSQNDKIWIYVNGRMVKDKLLHHAIKQAYEDILHPGRYPACLLYLRIHPSEVDVNVHPTKHELRFQQPRLVHDFISSQLRNALQRSQIQVNYQMAPHTKPLEVRESFSLPSKVPVSSLKPWVILNESFVLLFLQEQPYVVNLKGLQSAWLLSLLSKESYPLTSRPLLVPVSYPIGQLDAAAFHRYQPILAQVGIDLNLAGEHSLILRSLPKVIPHLDIKLFLAKFLAITEPSLDKVLDLITLCQSVNLQTLRHEEWEELIDYIQSLGTDRLKIFCKHLSTETCWGLLNNG